MALTASLQNTSSFSYLIAGGATAGLTLAARLTEQPNVTVLVLESGEDRSADVNVKAWGPAMNMSMKPEYD